MPHGGDIVNKDKATKYRLDQIYLYGNDKQVVVKNCNDDFEYIKIMPTFYFSTKFNSDNSPLLIPITEFITRCKIDPFLFNSNGQKKEVLSVSEIEIILDRITKYEKTPISALQSTSLLSKQIVDIISDLLGLNISVRPNSQLNLAQAFDITDVAVPRIKIDIFKKSLYEYLNSTLIYENGVIITKDEKHCDYHVSRSLKIAGIKNTQSILKNCFTLSANTNGIDNVKINGIPVNKLAGASKIR